MEDGGWRFELILIVNKIKTIFLECIVGSRSYGLWVSTTKIPLRWSGEISP
jgi:hypothetical protein